MDWTTILAAAVSALSTGGLVSALLYYRENKRARQIENEKSVIGEWQALAAERSVRCDQLKASLDAKDAKIDSLYKENNELRKRNDNLSSKVAVLSILRCKVVGCPDRVPPMGSRSGPEADAPNPEKQE